MERGAQGPRRPFSAGEKGFVTSPRGRGEPGQAGNPPPDKTARAPSQCQPLGKGRCVPRGLPGGFPGTLSPPLPKPPGTPILTSPGPRPFHAPPKEGGRKGRTPRRVPLTVPSCAPPNPRGASLRPSPRVPPLPAAAACGRDFKSGACLPLSAEEVGAHQGGWRCRLRGRPRGAKGLPNVPSAYPDTHPTPPFREVWTEGS